MGSHRSTQKPTVHSHELLGGAVRRGAHKGAPGSHAVMNFDYSDEQRALKDEARRFLRDRCTSAVTRRVLNDDTIPFERELWSVIAELGWLGIAIPEAYGGSGLGPIELCAL